MAFWQNNSNFNGKILKGFSLLKSNDSLNFSSIMLKNLISNILQDVIGKVTGLDELVLNSLYGNKAKVNQYNGLIDLIIYNYINQAKTCYSVQIENNTVIYTPLLNNKHKGTNSFYIDFSKVEEIKLLKNLYDIVYNLFKHAKISTQMANNLNIKINDLRAQSPQDKKFIEQQLQNMGESLLKEGGISYMDAKDSLEVLNINNTAYKEVLNMIYSQICHITRLPIGYIAGSASGNLNTTGEGERIQLDRALKGYFNEYLKPILVEISSILGVNKNITIAEDNLAKFESIAPFLTILEQSSLLNLEQKQGLIKQALGVDFA